MVVLEQSKKKFGMRATTRSLVQQAAGQLGTPSARQRVLYKHFAPIGAMIHSA